MSDDIEAFLRAAARRRANRQRPARSIATEPIVEAEALPQSAAEPSRSRSRPPVRPQKTSSAGVRADIVRDRQARELSAALDLDAASASREPPRGLKPTESTEQTSSTEENEWLSLLRNPTSIRQAVILGEILRRPNFGR
jgi:hypothetical protein